MTEKYTSKYFKLDYYQKSYAFLYPLLGFKEKQLFVPTNTYLYCDAIDESILDYKLLVLFKFQEKELFSKFETDVILKNDYLDTCYITEDGILYVFNLGNFSSTVDHFLNGEYSKLEKDIKTLILSFHEFKSGGKVVEPKRILKGEIKVNSGSVYPMSVLYPEEFKDEFIKDLVEKFDLYNSEGEAARVVREVKEIGDMFNLERETLNTKILEAKCM
jgi:hypothetical protein